MDSTENTVILISGANKGIGFEVARTLTLDRKVMVLIGARDRAAGERAAEKIRAEGGRACALQLDVTDAASIALATLTIRQDYQRLDVLVNNAGIALDAALPTQLPLDVLRATYETNVFGVFVLTNAMLPLLRLSAHPRIVNVSSGLGSLALRSDREHFYSKYPALAYCSSKTTVNAMTVAFALELESAGFKVNAADPGYTATDLNSFSGPRTVEQAATVIVRLATLPDDAPTGGFYDENGVVPW